MPKQNQPALAAVNRHTGGLEKFTINFNMLHRVNRHTGGLENHAYGERGD